MNQCLISYNYYICFYLTALLSLMCRSNPACDYHYIVKKINVRIWSFAVPWTTMFNGIRIRSTTNQKLSLYILCCASTCFSWFKSPNLLLLRLIILQTQSYHLPLSNKLCELKYDRGPKPRLGLVMDVSCKAWYIERPTGDLPREEEGLAIVFGGAVSSSRCLPSMAYVEQRSKRDVLWD